MPILAIKVEGQYGHGRDVDGRPDALPLNSLSPQGPGRYRLLVMRQTLFILAALVLLVAQPLDAAEKTPAPLAPGKPAGAKAAQINTLWSAYAPAVVFGALLAVTIGVSGSSSATEASTT